ncbi:macrophage-expressed gene 1 protein-like [Synchiropus splendidus]|uniref:macrophage-expressed gene 1 protein-like n=1 Tax=Synchiropus splendidus TaxID=270530 RepID=UPI00237D4FAF|nr:macrophage-expressed gene 1 protein-like [Synchiropus splendidus]
MKAAGALLSLALVHACVSVPISKSTNWLRECRASSDSSINALEVLPGGGWDNLRNMDMGRVMNITYFQCQTTEDGLYLIPDEVFVIPDKETGVETSSEIVQTWQEQKSATSSSINADVSFMSRLNGKFSVENQRMKIHQHKESSTMMRVQVRNRIYTVKAYPDFNLDARFAQLAKEIGDAIENKQSSNANYLSEKMVLEYGTHVITSLDAGASLVQEDYLTSSYLADNVSQLSTIRASAGLNFFDKLKFDIGGQSTEQSSSLQLYRSNIEYSLIQSHGGDAFYPGITLQGWQQSTRNNLVAIDRSGFPLQYFINVNTLPDLPQPTVSKVARSVSHAIERYYKINTRPGCVDPNSNNYNFQANLDDASCSGPATNLSFGGIYQACTPLSDDAAPLCDSLAEKNPDTGDFTCRSPYSSVFLRSEIRQQAYSQIECHEERYRCHLVFHCTRQVCQDVSHVRVARIDTHWCVVNGATPEHSGYLFGGFYGPNMINPITNTKGCPSNYIALKFLSDGQTICISNEYEGASKDAVPFGGLFSCESANPLAAQRQQCPPQFSQHLVSVSDGCEILYCVQSGLFTGGQLLPVHLPPFTRPPLISMQATNTVMVMTDGDKNWVRVGGTKMWKLATPEEIAATLKIMNPGEMSAGEKAGVALGVIALMALLVVAAVLVRRKRRGMSEYRQIEATEQDEERTPLIAQST